MLVTKEDIIAALESIDRNGVPLRYQSKTRDLVTEDG